MAAEAQGTYALNAVLEEEFPAVFNASKDLPLFKHRVVHHIETEGWPVAATYRWLDATRLKAAKAEFAELERQGVIRCSSIHWASALHLVKKVDGSWRPCGDFWQLNVQTKPDRYTCPNMGDLTVRLAGCRVFSKLDLPKGYHQVPVREEDVCKTAVVTPFGLYEFVRMPFGLHNATHTSQQDDVLSGLDCCFVYLDDNLVASKNEEEHVRHLREVFGRLEQHRLVLNAEKCEWRKTQLTYLGHEDSASSIWLTIVKFPQPETVQQLKTYLGMVNFYHRFLKGAVLVLKPLTNQLKGGVKGKLQWSESMQ